MVHLVSHSQSGRDTVKPVKAGESAKVHTAELIFKELRSRETCEGSFRTFSWKRVQIYHPKPQWTMILTDRHPSPKTSRRFLKTPRRFDRNVGAFSEKTIKFK